MIDTFMKDNTNIRYNKVWIRKQEEQVKKYQVLEIAILEIKRYEDKSTKKKEDVRYKNIQKLNEIKEVQLNKDQVQEIVISGIIEQDQSTGRKGEVKVHRNNDSTDEEEDDFAS
jgi:HJR/Mrr/RecB family endonuclease